jgi:hypothetical protein
MAMREIVRRLRAFEACKPLPRYSTSHVKISENAIVVAFVRMAGESRPWGVAYGKPGSTPKILSVPDGRDRDDISEMLIEFGADLLEHMRAEGFTFKPVTKADLPIDNPPQIWVPGPSHLEMLHFISYGFWQSRKADDLRSPLGALARLCTFLFAESRVTGQQLVLDAAAQLSQSFAYPVDNQSVSNLHAALTWHRTEGSYTESIKRSQEAARTSAGITMNLEVEQGLESALNAYRKSVQDGKPDLAKSDFIAKVVKDELSARWKAAQDAMDLLEADSRPLNSGVPELVKDSLIRYFYDFQRLERQMSDPDYGPAYTPHPETEHHGTAAASRYFRLGAAEAKYLPSLIHDDLELFREALAEGNAVEGKIADVVVDGDGRSAEIYWKLRVFLSDEFRVRVGEYLCFRGSPGHYVSVEELEFVDLDLAELTVKFLGKKTLAIPGPISEPPKSEAWIHQDVVFVPRDSSDLDSRASTKVWKTRQGPGSWLTHSKSSFSPIPNVIDDAVQLEGLR